MRVLHLIDPGSPGGGACTLRLLAEPVHRLNSVRQDVLIIGTTRHEALARRCGVPTIGRLCPPRSIPWAGADSLRHIIQLAFMQKRGYDLLHAWTPRSALLAAHAAPGLPVLGTFPTGPSDQLHMRQLRGHSVHAHVHLLAATRAVQRE